MKKAKTKTKKLTKKEMNRAVRIVCGDVTDKTAGIRKNWCLRDAEYLLPRYKFEEYYKQIADGVTETLENLTEAERQIFFAYITSCKMAEVADSLGKEFNKVRKTLESVIRRIHRRCRVDYWEFFGDSEKLVCLAMKIVPEKWEDLIHDPDWRLTKDFLSEKSPTRAAYVMDVLLDFKSRRLVEDIIHACKISEESVRKVCPLLYFRREFFLEDADSVLNKKAQRKQEWEKLCNKTDVGIEKLDLTVREYCNLKFYGISTVFDIIEYGIENLEDIPGIGKNIKTIMQGYIK